MRKLVLILFLVLPIFAFGEQVGQPHAWQLGFQESASPVMEYINNFHNKMLVIMLFIVVSVSALLTYTVIRFNKKRNPVPSKRSHNTLLEIVWTLIPLCIVIGIAFPSLRVLKYEEQIPESEMTVKIVGHQWYWTYSYPDHGEITFDSNLKNDGELVAGEPRLLAVDNYLVLPVDTNIRIQITSDDVIHSWAVPALGLKKDSIPGRLNETWVKIKNEGVYYGQCSELCGVLHGFMPIAVKAVNKDEFKKWVEQAKDKF
ncbi:cytochrome c oxidase, subunit II [Neorickettsia helminthoeca str. Oregon]|uniref:Cytochrome c oxidase subunit 2 n=1 Tax=Neorickettsia helminthoeca str. Oregon TaxID=1286528 RepID=X5GWY8_9RICK|nr:cytochrome c oxidase subunit II [Neorickettsia helminthoeca]AHX11532.1 cytochrome c oxidase, subunit II [Neorickettsia helminthoeca str. Oregon]